MQTSDGGVTTRLSLLLPEERKVPSMPLSDIETLEFRFLRFTVFLGIFAAFPGVATSYISGSEQRNSLVLVIITLIFAVLTVVFAVSAVRHRKTIKGVVVEKAEDQYAGMFLNVAVSLLERFGGSEMPLADFADHVIGLGCTNYHGSLLLDLVKREHVRSFSTGDSHLVQMTLDLGGITQ